jgi:hypothetical protein
MRDYIESNNDEIHDFVEKFIAPENRMKAKNDLMQMRSRTLRKMIDDMSDTLNAHKQKQEKWIITTDKEV